MATSAVWGSSAELPERASQVTTKVHLESGDSASANELGKCVSYWLYGLSDPALRKMARDMGVRLSFMRRHQGSTSRATSTWLSDSSGRVRGQYHVWSRQRYFV